MRRLLLVCAMLGLWPAAACIDKPAPPAAASATIQAQPGSATAGAANPGAAVAKDAKYDPTRDPALDLQSAVAEATRTGKRILLEVGGEWCVWCHIMHAYFEEHPDLLAYRDEKFVTLRVNFSEENENKAFLSQYPKSPGYPHLFVLDSKGRFLHSQGTAELESGRSYDLDRFTAFLKRWAPHL